MFEGLSGGSRFGIHASRFSRLLELVNRVPCQGATYCILREVLDFVLSLQSLGICNESRFAKMDPRALRFDPLEDRARELC
jgi:hypothetical protein